jgi:lambda repressor-like predicted transcriptional regulator
MKTEEIKEALRNQGLTYSMVAEASDLTVPYISSIITRATTSMRVATIISKVIDKPVEEVFPEMFVTKITDEKRQVAVDQLRQRLAS